jgi:hypothetical protein
MWELLEPQVPIMRNALRLLLLTTATAAMALVAPGCSSSADDGGDSSENDVTVNISGAKVALCDKDDGGCNKCDEKIGDYTLTADEREACTLTTLRGALKDRVSFLMGFAARMDPRTGRPPMFIRTGGTADNPFRLQRIKVIPDIGGELNQKSQFTKLAGSFTTSNDPNASGVKGGVSVYSVYMPVRIAFEFVDKTGSEVHEETFVMKNAYGLVPFFYMKAEMAVNLNVGSILSKFGGGPVGGALLSALGGEASLHVEAAHEVKWTTPVCADSSEDRSSKSKEQLRTFDNDFYANVLRPVCQMYKKDNNAPIDCWDGQTFDFATMVEKNIALVEEKILPLQSCSIIDDPLFGENTYDLGFVAPKAWGFGQGQKGNLYLRNDNGSDWERDNEMTVIGTDQTKCGNVDLKDGESCVHAKMKKAFFASRMGFGVDHCAQISAPGKRLYGVAQTDGTDPSDATIHYVLPNGG